MAVFLKNCAGEGASPNHKYYLVILLQFFYQGNEIAVSAYDNESVDMVACKGHFQRIQCQSNIRSIFISTGCQVSLDHLYRVLRHRPAEIFISFPVAVGNLGDNLPFFFDCLQYGADIKVSPERLFDTDGDIVKINKNRYL